jgi:hypothetical protein
MYLRAFRSRMLLLAEDAKVADWLAELVEETKGSGTQVHDANVVATMFVHGVDTVVTLSTGNFARFGQHVQVSGPASSSSAATRSSWLVVATSRCQARRLRLLPALLGLFAAICLPVFGDFRQRTESRQSHAGADAGPTRGSSSAPGTTPAGQKTRRQGNPSRRPAKDRPRQPPHGSMINLR